MSRIASMASRSAHVRAQYLVYPSATAMTTNAVARELDRVDMIARELFSRLKPEEGSDEAHLLAALMLPGEIQ